MERPMSDETQTEEQQPEEKRPQIDTPQRMIDAINALSPAEKARVIARLRTIQLASIAPKK